MASGITSVCPSVSKQKYTSSSLIVIDALKDDILCFISFGTYHFFGSKSTIFELPFSHFLLIWKTVVSSQSAKLRKKKVKYFCFTASHKEEDALVTKNIWPKNEWKSLLAILSEFTDMSIMCC